MNCEGCDKPINFLSDYYISVNEYLANDDASGADLAFCSWYCASSIVNEKYSEEREAEKAGA